MQNQSKKRILYVITKSNFGGAQRYVFELAKAMRDHGHTVAVATSGHGELVDRLREFDIETLVIDHLRRDINIGDEWQAFWSLKKTMSSWKPDIVHLNSSKAGALGSLAARLVGISTIVFTAHGWAFLEPRNPLWKLVTWSASYVTALLSHHVIVVSDNDRAHAPMFFLKNRCTRIYTAVSPFTLETRDTARETLFDQNTIAKHAHDVWLVSIAELTANKNLDASIRAVAEFNRSHQQQIFYSLIGTGELRETLSGLVREEDASSHISFLGHIAQARTYLDAFDMFILPSKKEGFPYAILEAGAANLPVIAARVGGIPELITDRETGILIDPDNYITIMQALKALVHDTELRTHVADALHGRVRSSFDLKSMVEKTEAVYL